MTIIVKTRNRAMEKLQAELDDRKRREEGKQFVDNPVEQEGSPKTKKPYIAPIVKPYTVPIDQDAEVAAIFDDLKDFRIDIGAGVKTPVEQLQDQAVVPTPNVVTPEGFTLEPTQAEAPADVPLIIGPSTTQELARDILNKRASPRIMGKGTVEESKGPKIVFDPVTGEKIDYSNVEKSQLEFERQSVEEKSIGVDLGSEASIEKFRKLWDYNLNDAALNEFVRSAITMTTILSDTSISDDYRGDFTAVDLIKNLLGVDANVDNSEIGATAQLAYLDVAEGAFGHLEGFLPQEDLFADTPETLTMLEDGGIVKESFLQMLGTKFKNRVIPEPLINEEGRALKRQGVDPKSTELISELIFDGLLRTGSISVASRPLVNLNQVDEVTGKPKTLEGKNPIIDVVYIGDSTTYSNVRAARELIRASDPSTSFKKAPVTPGGYIGSLAAVFGFNKKDPKIPKRYNEHTRIMNNTASFVDPDSIGFLTILRYLVETNYQSDNPDFFDNVEESIPGFMAAADRILNTKTLTDTTGMSEIERKRTERVIKQERTKASLEIDDIKNILKTGLQVFTHHMPNALTGRLINISQDLNTQRSKIQRGAIVAGNPTFVKTDFKNVPDKQLQDTIIPVSIINKVDERMNKEDYSDLNDGEKEAAFIYTIAYNLIEDLTGIKPAGIPMKKFLTDINWGLLSEAAKVGAVLRKVIPKDLTKEAMEDISTFNFSSLTKDEMMIISKAVSQMGKGDWGYKFKSYLAADEYLNGDSKSIRSKLTIEYDYSSAGTTTMQIDAGQRPFLQYVGVLSEHLVERYGDAYAFGTPRDFFLSTITDHLRELMPDTQIGSKIADGIDLARMDAESNAKLIAMSKGIILTIGYGRPAMFNYEVISEAIQDIPELMAVARATNEDVADIINKALTDSINKVISTTFTTAIKKSTGLLAMLGIAPTLETFYGMEVPLYQMASRPDYSATPVEIKNETTGETRLVYKTEKFPQLREKYVVQYINKRENEMMIRDDVDGISNRPAPVLGQQREVIGLVESILNVNKGREEKPIFAQAVFDNLQSDINGAFFFRAAMNGKAARAALGFNNTAKTLRAIAEHLQGSNLLALLPEEITLSNETDYGMMLQKIAATQRRVKDALDPEKQKKFTLAQKELNNQRLPDMKAFIDFFKNNPNEKIRSLLDNPESVTLTRNEYEKVILAYMKMEKISVRKLRDLADKSDEDSKKIMEEIMVMTKGKLLSWAG